MITGPQSTTHSSRSTVQPSAHSSGGHWSQFWSVASGHRSRPGAPEALGRLTEAERLHYPRIGLAALLELLEGQLVVAVLVHQLVDLVDAALGAVLVVVADLLTLRWGGGGPGEVR